MKVGAMAVRKGAIGVVWMVCKKAEASVYLTAASRAGQKAVR